MIVDPIGAIFSAISLTMIVCYGYYVYFGIIGFYKNHPSPVVPPKNRFAILVPAYNEERVIGGTVRNIRSSSYPKDLYDVFVITDNSPDRTAEIAAEEGAIVLERGAACEPGKGHALKWGIEQIKSQKKYDAYIIIDADNAISADFLAKMNNELEAGFKVMQGQLKSKNPETNWVTRTIHADYVMRNRFLKQPRADHNLCVFAEPGVCISAELLNKYGWNFTSITEDLELTCKLSTDGIRIRWVRDAEIYEEKPTKLSVAFKQRKRWMTGHADAFINYTRKLFSSAIRKKNTVALDCAMYLLFPLFTLIYLVGQIAFSLSRSGFTLLAILPESLQKTAVTAFFNIFLTIWWIFIPWIALAMEREKPWKYWYTPFTIMFMAIIQALLFAYGLVKRKDRNWWHTPHSVSSISIAGNRKENIEIAADPPGDVMK